MSFNKFLKLPGGDLDRVNLTILGFGMLYLAEAPVLVYAINVGWKVGRLSN